MGGYSFIAGVLLGLLIFYLIRYFIKKEKEFKKNEIEFLSKLNKDEKLEYYKLYHGRN